MVDAQLAAGGGVGTRSLLCHVREIRTSFTRSRGGGRGGGSESRGTRPSAICRVHAYRRRRAGGADRSQGAVERRLREDARKPAGSGAEGGGCGHPKETPGRRSPCP